MATGPYRLGGAKITNATGTGYSAAALTGTVTVGTIISQLRVWSGTAQSPGGAYTGAVFLYDSSTYWEYGSFTLTVAGDSYQWVDVPAALVLPSNSWSVVFAVRTPILAGSELHLLVMGQDVS